MKSLIIFTIIFMASACHESEKPKTTETLLEKMDRIDRYWARDKALHTPYRYFIGIWEGADFDGSILVQDDKVVARSYHDRSPFNDAVKYSENGAEVGTHDFGLPLRIAEDFFQACRDMIVNAAAASDINVVYQSVGYFSCRDWENQASKQQFSICPEELAMDIPQFEDCPHPKGF